MGLNQPGLRAATQGVVGVVTAISVALTAVVFSAGTAAGESNYSGLPTGWTHSTHWFTSSPEDYGCFADYVHTEGSAAPGHGTGSLTVRLGPVSGLDLHVPIELTGLTAASVWLRSNPSSTIPPELKLTVVASGHSYTGVLTPPTPTWVDYDLGAVPLSESGGLPTSLAAIGADYPGPAAVSLQIQNMSDFTGSTAQVDGWSVTHGGSSHTVDLEGPTPPTSSSPTSTAPSSTAPSSSTPSSSTPSSSTPSSSTPTGPPTTSPVPVDTTGPRAVKTSPATGARSVRLRPRVKVFVSEALAPASVNRRSVTLVRKNQKVKAKVTYRATGKVIVLTPVRRLLVGSRYVVTVTPRVSDAAANRWDQVTSRSGSQRLRWAFHT